MLEKLLLYCLIIKLSHTFQIEEVPGEFTQDDLAEDDVMLLDAWEQVKLDLIVTRQCAYHWELTKPTLKNGKSNSK